MTAWTPERVAALTRMVTAGHTYKQIAHTLGGGLTRNAICGKVFRLGLSTPEPLRRDRTAQTSRHQHKAARMARGRMARFKKAKTRQEPLSQPLPAEPVHSGALVALVELRESSCRWPVGDPAQPGFGFCGCPRREGGPYCDSHRARAFSPLQLRKQVSPR
jgi:GcrA cell cycle regulator